MIRQNADILLKDPKEFRMLVLSSVLSVKTPWAFVDVYYYLQIF